MASLKLRKYLLIGFNVLYGVSGLAAIIVGSLSDDTLLKIIFIIVGVLALIVAAFGLFGAMKENVCLLRTFGVLLGIIVALNIIQGINFIRSSGSYKEALDTLLQYYKDESTARDAFDELQSKVECCGVTVPSDWTKYYPRGEYPWSCCPEQPHNDTQACTAGAGAYTTGCLSAIRKMNVGYGVGGFIVLVFQIAAIVISCSLPGRT